MNRTTLAKLKKIAADRGYEVKFEKGRYKILKLVDDFQFLHDAENFLLRNQIPPSPPTPPPLPKLPKYNLDEVWEFVLLLIDSIPRRELYRQMCKLISFDGEVAFISVKHAWYGRISDDKHSFVKAFQKTCGRTIDVIFEKIPQQIPPPPIPQPPPPQPSYSQKITPVSLLVSGKYHVRILGSDTINQGYPELDGKKYYEVLKTVDFPDIFSTQNLAIGMGISIGIRVSERDVWFLNFVITALNIQSLSLPNGRLNKVFVAIQPINSSGANDHYLSVHHS